MIVSTLFAAVLAAGSPGLRAPPVMQVPAAGLDLSDAREAALFADRVVEQSRRFCAVHVERITPEHPANPRFCERGMAEAAVRALPEPHRQRFVGAGGSALVYRRLR
jgi:UrcA family protein